MYGVFVLCVGCSSPPADDPNDLSGFVPDVADVDQASNDVTLMPDLGRDLDESDSSLPDTSQPELRDAALLAALRRDAASTMLSLGYDAARDAMYAVGGIEDQGGRIECVYTGRTVDADGTRVPSGNCTLAGGMATTCMFNTEHTVARVELRNAFGEGTPDYDIAEGDLHHLFPSDELANNARANFAFGDTSCAASGNCAFDEGSQLGLPVGGSGPTSCPMGVDAGEDLCVLQVRPQRRGDVARAVFYMSMRYGLEVDAGVESALRIWHAADLPDAWELGRNAAVEQVQGNRNPFVDDPTLVDRISNF